jgi:hypothetical protein
VRPLVMILWVGGPQYHRAPLAASSWGEGDSPTPPRATISTPAWTCRPGRCSVTLPSVAAGVVPRNGLVSRSAGIKVACLCPPCAGPTVATLVRTGLQSCSERPSRHDPSRTEERSATQPAVHASLEAGGRRAPKLGPKHVVAAGPACVVPGLSRASPTWDSTIHAALSLLRGGY